MGEPAKPINERRAGDMPVLCTDIRVLTIDADIHEDADKDKYHNGHDLKKRKPIFCTR
jgi:hypothetical protein